MPASSGPVRRHVVKKPMLSAVVTAALVMTLAACNSDDGQTDQPGDSAGGGQAEKVTIGFVPGLASDPFFLSMRRGAEEAATELGVELLWQGSPDEWSPESQIPYVDNMLTAGVDALILNPTDPTALQGSVDKAISTGIPVVIVDQAVEDQSEVTAYMTGDNVAGGRAAAEELIEQIGGKGKVFILGSAPADSTNILRIQGFEEVVEDNPDIEVVGIEYQNSSSERAASIINTIILANPDLAGIFAVNGTGTTGAASALRNKGAQDQIKLVGYDAYTAAVDELRDGVVAALVAQQPGEQGRLAVQYAFAKVTGEGADEIQAETIIENIVLNQGNLTENAQYVYED